MSEINNRIRSFILNRGVANLHEFGYPGANTQNILTDPIYKVFFKSMLEENLNVGDSRVAAEVAKLLEEVK
jgi:hypothetical protein